MVNKSLKTRIVSVLLFCLMSAGIFVVPAIQADETGAVVGELSKGISSFDAWAQTAIKGRALIGAGCKLLKDMCVSDVGNGISVFAADVIGTSFETGEVWLKFLRRHSFGCAMVIAGAGVYSIGHKLYYGTWFPKIKHN